MRKSRLHTYVKILLLLPALLCSLWFLLSYGLYRIPSGDAPVVVEGEVQYKLLELGLTNRDVFESVLPSGLNLVRIGDELEFYVSASDRKLLWKENPFVMRDKRISLRAKLLAEPLFFGGYGTSRVIEVQRLSGSPAIRK